ncbi:hypothetical protein FPRO04_14232 [Fusarium proliferatum]|nr:hypothetical protein FPRO04_14232 [Fusarium proliferatum]
MSVVKPQYQHFIPQFMLRNFDHPFVCPTAPRNGRKCKKHQHDKGKYPGDRVVNSLQLLPDGFKFEEQSINRVCGLDDMYTDKSPMAESSRELEVKFSKLEAAASPIIRKIIASHQRGDEHVKITRTQQTILRKFVYLLKQRNDQKTGEFLCLGPKFHLFIPISPRLVIVLRSQHLPEPHEDANPELKAKRHQQRQISIDSVFGTGTKSILEDLPVHKALNNYSTYVNGRGMGRPGWDGQLRQTDSFLFPFFKISTRHIRVINGLLLDHAFHALNIIFFQKGPFLDLLEWYLTEPCEVGKRLSGEYAQDKKRYIEQLATFMVAEGRKVTANFRFERTWHDLDIEAFKKQTNATAQWLEERGSSHSDNENTGKKGNQTSEPETDGSLEDAESRTVLESGTTDNHQPKDEPLKNVTARWLEELGDSHNNNDKGKNVEKEETPPHEGDAKVQDTVIQKAAESMTKADDEPNRAEKGEDNPLENEWIAEIYNLFAEKWKSPHVPSDDETKALNLKKSLVMIRVWLRNARLDSADDRLETLLEGYQSRQPPVVFWLFLKRFRYALWSQEIENTPKHDIFSQIWPWPRPEDGFSKYPLTFNRLVLNLAMWKTMSRDIAMSRDLGENLSLVALTSLCLKNPVSERQQEIKTQDIEESTLPEPDNAEQPDLISEKDVYVAFRGSPSLLKIAGKRPNDQLIRKAARKREKSHQVVKDLIHDNIFTCTESASRRFPTLFPKEQILSCEEGQETAAGDSSTKNIEPLDGECSHPNETADGFGGNHSFPNLEFFQNSKTFETEGNAESLPNLLGSVGRIQNIILLRLDLNFEQVNQFLLNAEEFIRLLDTPLYLDAVKQLRQRIEEVLLMANRDAALVHDEADGKVVEIEAQRERLNREEEGVKRHRDENLDNIRVSIERDIFAAIGQAKDTLPGIGLADNR